MELPNHVGIIMDGNGRWAQKRGLKRSLGHKAGADNLEKLLDHIYNLGIKYVSVYAFSTENFKRDKEEVDYLMDLFVKMFSSKKKIFVKNELKVLFSGRRDNLRDDVRKSLENLEESTKDFSRGVLNICLNYGGRCEIVDMTKKIAQDIIEGKTTINDIDEKIVNRYMYQDLPDIDFVIRTSGEMRISNFMLWQSSYAEFYFPKTLFPDFTEEEFDKAILEYQNRNRRFGG
jgi:undecaprenyl diphosphate synthase